MDQTIETINNNIESIPGYDYVMSTWQDAAGDIIETKNPFFVEKPNGDTERRKPPVGITQNDQEVWTRIMKKAWTHDQCFLGWFWLDLGIGSAPLAALIPVIGPMCMYAVHYRLVSLGEQLQVPLDIQAKMSGNILLDFLISLFPILGSIFCWLNACSTRNAAMIDTFLRKRAIQQQRERGDFQLVDQREYMRQQQLLQQQRGQQVNKQQQKKQAPPKDYQQRRQYSDQQIDQWHHTQQNQHRTIINPNSQWKAPQEGKGKGRKGQVGQMESGVL